MVGIHTANIFSGTSGKPVTLTRDGARLTCQKLVAQNDEACRVVMERFELRTKRDAVNFALRRLSSEAIGEVELDGKVLDVGRDTLRVAVDATAIAELAILERYAPPAVSADDLEQTVDTSDEWVYSRTGIRQRHIAADDQNASDLALEACNRALQAAGLSEGPRPTLEGTPGCHPDKSRPGGEVGSGFWEAGG